MDLKTEFVKFIKEELNIPLVGITLPEDFSQEDVERIHLPKQLLLLKEQISLFNLRIFLVKDALFVELCILLYLKFWR